MAVREENKHYPLCISIASLRSKHYISELPLRVGSYLLYKPYINASMQHV